MSGLEMKAYRGRLVHVRPTGRIDEEDLGPWMPPANPKRVSWLRRLFRLSTQPHTNGER